ncbi:orotate phosphoribosyltransferase [Pediococcus siamensis]|uniref:orotate phosphoribosyltransferase n=1 Tax=Pediococcus siamensis TaxID=381829 RepID=UPI00399FFC23
MTIAQKVAHDLLQIGAVTLRPNEPFTWASGMKSPIYCDNRLTISYPEVRNQICAGLVEIVKMRYADAEVIAGTATAGIPHAAWLADQLNLPMIYVRSKPKDHGQSKQIEGVIKPGKKVVVIDDLISTGGSVLKAVEAVKQAGAEVIGVAGIFSYELAAATTNFQKANLPLQTVTTYSTLIHVAKAEDQISDAELAILKQWRQQG